MEQQTETNYNNDEFRELESKFDDIHSKDELHNLIEDMYEYLEELVKQTELSKLNDIPEEIEDRQSFINDVINYIQNAVILAKHRLSDNNLTLQYERKLMLNKITFYKDSIYIRSQFDDEDFNNLKILPDDYVIAKNKILVRPSFEDIMNFLNDYLKSI